MNKSKTNATVTVIIAVVLAGAVGWYIGDRLCASSNEHDHASIVESDKKLALYTNMRQLWAEHMQYTYSTVDAYFNNQNELQPSLDRLLQNQKDIGDAIRPVYGNEAADKLTGLLKTHINSAVPVLAAAKSGDTDALNKAVADWHANAKDIADFLSAANPDNWPESATEPMLKKHIDTTITYATDLAKGDYAQAIKDYDEASAHMIMLADTLSKGVIAQHADKF